MVEGKILKVSGPLVIAEGMREANMFDVVRVGDARLIGEIIEMHGDRASIQVYEETAGIGRGDRVVSTGAPLSVELGPGLIKNIYDGIQRPLEIIREKYGANITKGIDEPALSREKRWHFTPAVAYQDEVSGGDVLGTVQETDVILHRQPFLEILSLIRRERSWRSAKGISAWTKRLPRSRTTRATSFPCH